MTDIIFPNQVLATSYNAKDKKMRVLKVEEIGDFWAKRTIPSIRLQGKWMLRAGVLPNHYVLIANPSPGTLLIQLIEESPLSDQVEIQPTNQLKKQSK
jgi:hypothetical protein